MRTRSESMAEAALPRATAEDGFFCGLWRVAALDAELTALRARVAERDASLAWAVRRGRKQ